MNTVETINYKGFEIEACYDESAESPDNWGNEDCFLVYDHRQFFVERKGFEPQEIYEAMHGNRKLFDGYFYFPVYAYIHSGVALSLGRNSYPFTDKWDTSFNGFALVKRERGTYTRQKAYERAQGLIETWNMYLSGDVYGYNSEVGGCWGYYGKEGYEQMISEAKSEIDCHIKEQNKKAIKEHLKFLKIWIKNKVPMYRRQPLFIPFND